MKEFFENFGSVILIVAIFVAFLIPYLFIEKIIDIFKKKK